MAICHNFDKLPKKTPRKQAQIPLSRCNINKCYDKHNSDRPGGRSLQKTLRLLIMFSFVARFRAIRESPLRINYVVPAQNKMFRCIYNVVCRGHSRMPREGFRVLQDFRAIGESLPRMTDTCISNNGLKCRDRPAGRSV